METHGAAMDKNLEALAVANQAIQDFEDRGGRVLGAWAPKHGTVVKGRLVLVGTGHERAATTLGGLTLTRAANGVASIFPYYFSQLEMGASCLTSSYISHVPVPAEHEAHWPGATAWAKWLCNFMVPEDSPHQGALRVVLWGMANLEADHIEQFHQRGTRV